MKILLIGFSKIKYMPYLNFYLNMFEDYSDISILYWNRDLKSEELNIKYNYFEFKTYQEDDVNKFCKIKNFIKFKKFSENIIKNNDFDLIIVMHSIPAVLLSSLLKSKYRYSYLFDYRDYTYESIFVYKMIISKVVKYSKCTFVSSDGYRKYLPKKYAYKTFTSHNIMKKDLLFNNKPKKVKSDKIRIAFWGFIREENLNKEIIKKIANDNRFELHYYGRMQDVAKKLEQYASSINATNVFFHGEYIPEDRYDFSTKTDIIHNVFNSKNMMMSMSNKYYDGLIFKIPQICMKNSFMGGKITTNNIGFEVDPFSENFTDDIYNYYNSINFSKFIKSCDVELKKICKEIDGYANLLD